MGQQFLDHFDVLSVLPQQARERVSKSVKSNTLADAGLAGRLLDCLPSVLRPVGLSSLFLHARKDPITRAPKTTSVVYPDWKKYSQPTSGVILCSAVLECQSQALS